MERTRSSRSLRNSGCSARLSASRSVRWMNLKGLAALIIISFRPLSATFRAISSSSASDISATGGLPGSEANQTYSTPMSFAVGRASSSGIWSSLMNMAVVKL